MAAVTPRRPYLVRAIYVRDGRITLNVSWQATQGLKLGNEWIEFSARFGGVSQQVKIPVTSVLGIYARETGQGMLFQDEGETPPPAADSGSSNGSRPKLRVIK
jgi:stringent starvation protein B